MTPQEEHWRQIFLDAYKNNTGDDRRLALNEAWYNFVCSEDYHNLNLTEIQGFAHGHYSYWTALVDASHVDQESEVVRPWVSASFVEEPGPTGYVGRIAPLTVPVAGSGYGDAIKRELEAKGIIIGGGGGAPGETPEPGFGGAGGDFPP